jgi:hypothetical protein
MADQLLFADSHESQKSSEPFVSRQLSYIIDQNNGSYTSGQVQIDTSSLSNSGKFASYSEGYIVMPLVVALYTTGSDADFGKAAANWSVGLKNGYHQLIDNFSVEYNNTTVIQNTPMSNMYMTYKMMMSLSQDDLHKIAPSIGFWPDTSDSFNYQATATGDGLGESNNRNFGFENIYPTNWGRIFAVDATSPVVGVAAGVPFTSNGIYTSHFGASTQPSANTGTGATSGPGAFLPPSTANFGLYKRQKMIQFNPAAAPWSSLLQTQNTQNLIKNYYVSAGGATGYKVWYVNAIIRLKDMSDFFQQIPLVKGAYLRFIINLNLASSQVLVGSQASGSTEAPSQTPAGITLTQVAGGSTLTKATNPLILASATQGNGMDSVALAGTTLVVACGIQKLTITPANGTPTQLSHPLTSVRLYCPLYTFSPIGEQSYLSMNKTKVVTYRDIFNYRVPAQPTGTQFNQLLTNGIVNPKSILILPFFSTTGNAGGFSPYQSVFSTAPATTSPLAAIGDFNIQLAGVNVFQINESYDWQNFLDETQHVHCLNGGLVTGLTSGLVTEYDWQNSYRYYTVNLARRLASEDQVPKSIMLLGKNYSQLSVEYIIFVETERSITLDLNLSGSVVPKGQQVISVMC